jgi:hypothetical protein
MKRIRVAWALFFAVGGCSSPHHHGMMDDKGDRYWQGQQELASLIDQTVKDPQKAQEVKKLAAEIVTELKTGREQEHAYHRQLHVLNSSYTATPEEFMKIIDEGNHQRMRTAAKILSLRFKMKDQMTADEWQVLSDSHAGVQRSIPAWRQIQTDRVKKEEVTSQVREVSRRLAEA